MGHVCPADKRHRHYGVNAKTLLLCYTHVILFILDSITVRRAQFRPPDPGGVGFPLRGNRLGRCPKPQQNFDKGFGDIAAAAWHGGIWARHWFQRQSLYQNR